MAFFLNPPPQRPSSSSTSLVRLGVLILPPPFLLLILLLFCLVSTSSLMASSSFATMPVDRDRSHNRWRELNTVGRPRFVVSSSSTTSGFPESPRKGKSLDRWQPDRVKDVDVEKSEGKFRQVYQAKSKTKEGKCQQEFQVKNIAGKTKEGICQQESQVKDIVDKTKEGRCQQESQVNRCQEESQVKVIADKLKQGRCQQESQVKCITVGKNEGKVRKEPQMKDVTDKTKEERCKQEFQTKDIAVDKNEGKVRQESLVIRKLEPDGDNSSEGSGNVGSLIQKWRELEAEAAVTPSNRSSGHHQFSPTSQSSDDAGWESDLTVESEKEHVQGGVGKRYEFGIGDQESSNRRSGDKVFAGMFDGTHLRIRGREQIEKLCRKFEGERKREVEWLAERRAVSGFVHRKKIQNFLRYKSLQKHLAVQNLRPKSTAQELDQLNHEIAIFCLRQQFSPGPQQTCTSLPVVEKKTPPFHMTFPINKSESMSFEMRQDLRPAQEKRHTYVPTVEKKSSSYNQSSTDYLNSENYELEQIFSPRRRQQACESVPTSDKKSIFHLSLSNNCFDSKIHQGKQSRSFAPLSSTVRHEEPVEHDLDDIIQADEDSLASGSEDLQEDSQHPDISWEEGSLQTRTMVWGKPSDPSVLQSVQDEIETKKTHMDNHQEMGESDGTWLSNTRTSELQSGSGPAVYTDLLETYSDNSELRDLLERRTVSTSLSSDFREKLDKVILSSLQRRRMAEENFIEEDEDEFVQNYDYAFHADEGNASSLSLLPLSSQTHAQRHCQECIPTNRHVIQMDVVLDMRTDIANIHTEMSELRKLLASYMEKNTLPYSVQEDVTTVVRRSVSVGNSSFSSQREPVNKGTCCICYEKQVDSLLYRCGHMCACFKCATELQWSSGRCPVCRSPIVDVVRAYTYS